MCHQDEDSPAPPIVFAVTEKIWKELKSRAKVWKVCSQRNSLQSFKKITFVKFSDFLILRGTITHIFIFCVVHVLQTFYLFFSAGV